MDISNIATTGRIEVDAKTLTTALRRRYIQYIFNYDSDMKNGELVSIENRYELHYLVYETAIGDYVNLVHVLTNEQSEVIRAFNIVWNAVHDL